MPLTLKHSGPASQFEYAIDGNFDDLTDRERAFAQLLQPAVTGIVAAVPADTELVIEAAADQHSLSLLVEITTDTTPPAVAQPGEQARPADQSGPQPDQPPVSPEPARSPSPGETVPPAGDAPTPQGDATVPPAGESGQDAAAPPSA